MDRAMYIIQSFLILLLIGYAISDDIPFTYFSQLEGPINPFLQDNTNFLSCKTSIGFPHAEYSSYNDKLMVAFDGFSFPTLSTVYAVIYVHISPRILPVPSDSDILDQLHKARIGSVDIVNVTSLPGYTITSDDIIRQKNINMGIDDVTSQDTTYPTLITAQTITIDLTRFTHFPKLPGNSNYLDYYTLDISAILLDDVNDIAQYTTSVLNDIKCTFKYTHVPQTTEDTDSLVITSPMANIKVPYTSNSLNKLDMLSKSVPKSSSLLSYSSRSTPLSSKTISPLSDISGSYSTSVVELFKENTYGDPILTIKSDRTVDIDIGRAPKGMIDTIQMEFPFGFNHFDKNSSDVPEECTIKYVWTEGSGTTQTRYDESITVTAIIEPFRLILPINNDWSSSHSGQTLNLMNISCSGVDYKAMAPYKLEDLRDSVNNSSNTVNNNESTVVIPVSYWHDPSQDMFALHIVTEIIVPDDGNNSTDGDNGDNNNETDINTLQHLSPSTTPTPTTVTATKAVTVATTTKVTISRIVSFINRSEKSNQTAGIIIGCVLGGIVLLFILGALIAKYILPRIEQQRKIKEAKMAQKSPQMGSGLVLESMSHATNTDNPHTYSTLGHGVHETGSPSSSRSPSGSGPASPRSGAAAGGGGIILDVIPEDNDEPSEYIGSPDIRIDHDDTRRSSYPNPFA